MAELKTKVTNASVSAFIRAVSDEVKRKDSQTLLTLFKEVTKEKPKMWGSSIIGFGSYHYKSERSTQEGDWPLTGFSPRAQNLTLYIMLGLSDYTDLLAQLGKHKTGKGCLYIKKLQDVDLAVLRKIIAHSYKAMKEKYTT